MLAALSFKDAADYVGKPIPLFAGQRRSHSAPTVKAESHKAIITTPPDSWTTRAQELITGENRSLLEDIEKLNWLREQRGINHQTVERFKIGWIEENIYGSRSAWGLPEELREDGKLKKLFIPAGLVIPGPDRIRIRRSEPGDYGKYYVLPGSGNAPMILNGDRPADTTAALIVESELDAILLHQELHTNLLIVATGSTSNGPSGGMVEDLRQRPFVLVALDSDQAGGKAAWDKWLSVLRNACRAPIPASWGKDHTEAYLNGHDLNLWLSAACELVVDMSAEKIIDIIDKSPGDIKTEITCN